MGYVAVYRGAEIAIARAKQAGMATVPPGATRPAPGQEQKGFGPEVLLESAQIAAMLRQSPLWGLSGGFIKKPVLGYANERS